MRTVKIVVCTEDGEVLDQVTIETDEQYVAVRPVGYSMGKYPNEEVLNLGVGN